MDKVLKIRFFAGRVDVSGRARLGSKCPYCCIRIEFIVIIFPAEKSDLMFGRLGLLG
jgi:hypothetical protein